MARHVQLHSLGEARKLLAKRGVTVSYRTLRRWIDQGRVHAHHMPHRSQQAGQWLLDGETIAALAETMRRGSR